MEVWSQVGQDWQRDWFRETARQIVILACQSHLVLGEANVSGKIPLRLLPCEFFTAGTGIWTDDRVRENGIQSAGKTKRVGRMWLKAGLSLWLGIIFIHLWFFLTSSNCISFPSVFTTQKQQPCLSTSDTSLANDSSECHSFSTTLKSPQVPGSKNKKNNNVWQQEANVGKWGGLRKCLFFRFFFHDFRTN